MKAPRIKLSAEAMDSLGEVYSRQRRAGSTVRAREQAAKRPARGTDRRFKADRRDRQYNTNVTTEIFDLVASLMDEFDLTKAELTERAIRLYSEHLRSGGT
jgi:hypothetical protein